MRRSVRRVRTNETAIRIRIVIRTTDAATSEDFRLYFLLSSSLFQFFLSCSFSPCALAFLRHRHHSSSCIGVSTPSLPLQTFGLLCYLLIIKFFSQFLVAKGDFSFMVVGSALLPTFPLYCLLVSSYSSKFSSISLSISASLLNIPEKARRTP